MGEEKTEETPVEGEVSETPVSTEAPVAEATETPVAVEATETPVAEEELVEGVQIPIDALCGESQVIETDTQIVFVFDKKQLEEDLIEDEATEMQEEARATEEATEMQ